MPQNKRLSALLNEPKNSSTIHFDEDTIPHGDCADPVRCDCCCPHCWNAKADIIRAALNAKISAWRVEAEGLDRQGAAYYRGEGGPHPVEWVLATNLRKRADEIARLLTR